ncbi:PREDICTED: uncharacterized protein LOC104592133 [Nelumbo nucifera]|uniref:Uncharacterized protein LOC104592133 n=2 Tax=Nelumbo nucifera TaxID=4432 RepID=A0A1U7ZAJ2_NELNU|nr:PREDICTED: uncharacterized protein LOC104592133 [Nelumbo nucifera]XP_010249645.1 PREDICTED: uncharacterized protein LOC104592133 [Nelumbo nucifera]DAD35580.1 TPA_asm: hypothetical protein HUJ06_006220 [Nelumbo nucifera]
MASSSLRSNLCSFAAASYSSRKQSSNQAVVIRCGPRDNRGPIVKGRVLSTEAIHAVQALKRAQRADEAKVDELVSRALSRLIKADLLASLGELLRQDQCHLALKVFSAVRSELWYKTDCSLYADVVAALARNGMSEEIDRLISEMEEEGLGGSDGRGLSRLIKALVAAERVESTVGIYRLMKRAGWGSSPTADEYVVKVLSRGMRRLGKRDVADELDSAFDNLWEGNLEKSSIIIND